MQHPNTNESGNLSVFITGALVGAGLALLFAPQSGSQMRSLLRDYATRAKDEFDDVVEEGVEMVDSTLEHGKEFVEKGVEKGKDTLREAGRQAKGFADAGKQAINETKDELASQHR